MSWCPSCHVLNACACKSCVGRNGITGREEKHLADGMSAECFNCGWQGSASEWMESDWDRWKLGLTLGVFQDEVIA